MLPRRDDMSHHSDTARLEAFSDGVFAIAITLLVLEIAVPHLDESESLARAMRDLWPSYLGYALSFITIGIMWANHHAMFRDIDRSDHLLVVFNTVLLMCVSFLPFTTAVLAEYMTNDAQAVTACLAYGVSLTITAILFQCVWLRASVDRRLIDEHVSDGRLRSRTVRYLPGPLLYGIGVALAFVNTWAAIALWIALAAVYLLPLPE